MEVKSINFLNEFIGFGFCKSVTKIVIDVGICNHNTLQFRMFSFIKYYAFDTNRLVKNSVINTRNYTLVRTEYFKIMNNFWYMKHQ